MQQRRLTLQRCNRSFAEQHWRDNVRRRCASGRVLASCRRGLERGPQHRGERVAQGHQAGLTLGSCETCKRWWSESRRTTHAAVDQGRSSKGPVPTVAAPCCGGPSTDVWLRIPVWKCACVARKPYNHEKALAARAALLWFPAYLLQRRPVLEEAFSLAPVLRAQLLPLPPLARCAARQ